MTGHDFVWHSPRPTGPKAWEFRLSDTEATLTTPDGAHQFHGADVARLGVRRGLVRRSLVVRGPGARRIGPVTKDDGSAITAALRRHLARFELQDAVRAAVDFRQAFTALLESHLTEQRWIPHDAVVDVLARLPPAVTEQARRDAARAAEFLTPGELDAYEFLMADHWALVRETNAAIRRSELHDRAEFFERIEKSPLTDEQIRAVVEFDNRVRVIAAAGSGKTSVMVARAAYAISRGFVEPSRVLLLAFNADAATELQQRMGARLAAAGIDSAGVRASTFHSFGRSVIGEASNRKPSIAKWVESGRDVDKIVEIVDALRDESLDFRFRWDAFRLLYGRVSDTPDGGEPDSYDRASRVRGFQTFHGETVRSEGERMIADWLFLNGVKYEYERPYEHDVADSAHAQYRPDFFYPDVDVWHEHWALGADGTPPEAFAGYQESMLWKKQLHGQYGTKLVETTWHEILNLSGFAKLVRDLERHGLTLDWNPDRPIPGAQPLEHEQVARLVRTFMSHVKSNGLTREELARRIDAQRSPTTARLRLFVDLYWQVHDRWELALRAANAIDFDDMLSIAADHVEADPALARYDLVLVDEFQDTSRARARLVRALVRGAGKYLLAVGDDWQSINRFAGADISVMTDFETIFGPATTERLQTTFRCSQPIADVSSRFVSVNPAQLRKEVRAVSAGTGQAVEIVRVPDRESLPNAIRNHVASLARREPAGTTVDVLGRFNHERDLAPASSYENLTVTFRTVHRAKGLEADYVIVPNVTTGRYGFPSQIEDDPVLTLAMTGTDDFPFAEERRLFYVALTRAKRGVTVFTVAGLESPFVVELLDDPDVTVTNIGTDGEETTAEHLPVLVCAKCGQGTLVLRAGRYGEFYGCSRFPKCDGVVKKSVDEGRPAPTSRTPKPAAVRRCPVCETGTMVVRKGRYGKFLGCNRYPNCRHTEQL
jgi:DNA helicase-4